MNRIPKIPKKQYFWLKDGRELKNLHMLVAELPKMEDSVYAHHVNSKKNDFANWVEHTMNEIDLASKMKTVKNKHHMKHLLKQHFKEKSIYEDLQSSIKHLGFDTQQNVKTRIWLGVFVAVSVGAMITFLSLLI